MAPPTNSDRSHAEAASVALSAFDARMGPVARVLADSDEDTSRRVEAALAETLAPYHDGTGVRMDSACWICSAAA